MHIVLVNGCFDILHTGHVEHLREARAMGDKLIVALTIDGKVNKGPNRPINTWNDRSFLLRELRCVDEVIPTSSAINAIRHVKPAYFVKGIDYADGKHWTEDVVAACEEVGTLLRFTKAPKQSATEIIKKAMA
jgi:D-beta-D-heptose 7-phosphate kinase/D-beta-D-heptose 1-phosphate adenosyltransferase